MPVVDEDVEPGVPDGVDSDPDLGIPAPLPVSPLMLPDLLLPLVAAPWLLPPAAAPASLLLGDDIDLSSPGERDAVELHAAKTTTAAIEISHLVIPSPVQIVG